MQIYFPFYDIDSQVEDYIHLDYLKEYFVEDLQDLEFCKSLLNDFISDKELVLGGNYPQQDIANEIQLAIDYLLRLHTILNSWLKLRVAQLELINSN